MKGELSTARSCNRALFPALLFSVSGWVLCSCGGFDGCGNAPESSSSTAPRLVNFRFVEQLDGDPWTLVFAARFEDVDGDLQPGRAEFHLDDNTDPSGSFELDSVFRQSALSVDAQEGEVALTLRLVDSVDDGSDLRIGLRLIDAAGQSSNCEAVEVEFAVSSAIQGLEGVATQLLALVSATEEIR